MRKHGSRSVPAVAEEPLQTSFVVVDYPQEKEVVTSPEYTLRLGASIDAGRVEVSIDGGDWQACRPAVGYWWFDWAGYSKVSHRIQARAAKSDGSVIFSEPRSFSVKLPKPAGAPKPAAKAVRAVRKLLRFPVLEA